MKKPDGVGQSVNSGVWSSTQEPFAMPIQSGEIVAGKYKVLELLGTGGVGFVVSATHVGLEQQVALKFLRPEFTRHEEAVRRFMIEAKANFKIKSDHVVRVLDVDALPDGVPFMVMELLDGVDLRRVLETRGPLPVELAVEYVLQSCEALADAHAAHIIHRDVKPENLFVTRDAQGFERIKVLDFGISKLALTGSETGSEPPTLTVTAVGTPSYMSPEQVRVCGDIDTRTDVWSLGCVLYELLTGAGPFDRLSLMQSCAAVLEEEPAPLCETGASVPAELDAVIMRCLQKDPSQRFGDVGELARALSAFSQNGGGAWAERSSRAPDARSARASDAPISSGQGSGPASVKAERVSAGQALSATLVPTQQNIGRSAGARRSPRWHGALFGLFGAALLGGGYFVLRDGAAPAARPAAHAKRVTRPSIVAPPLVAVPTPPAEPRAPMAPPETPRLPSDAVAPTQRSDAHGVGVKVGSRPKSAVLPYAKTGSDEPDVGF